MSRSIKHQIFFSHAPQKVWDYLTKPELMEKWLMKTNFFPVVGHEFQFRTSPIPSLDFDGVFYCKVLEIVPLQKLSYTWRSGPGNGEITLDSIVTWRLEPKDNGTEVFLDHSGFYKEENMAFYKGLTDGWLKNLQKIDKLLNVVV